MKFTIWNVPCKLALACLVITMGITSQSTQAGVRQATFTITKNALMALPFSTQKRIAIALNEYTSLKTDATEWRLKLLIDDFMDTDNQRPLSYYIDEFLEIMDAHPNYFQELVFEHALKANTPNKDQVIQTIRDGLNKTKHSTNITFIKTMLYLPIRKWVRKDSKIPTDAQAEKALRYHASFNKG